jgi:hypothetical protein
MPYTSSTDSNREATHSNDCECRSAGLADDVSKLDEGCDTGQHHRSRG